MSSHSYYNSDLAWVHHVGYSNHAEQTGPGVVALLREGGLAPGATILDVGCGSGVLARQLRTAGFAVRGVGASPAMIELARDYEPGAPLATSAMPVIVSLGHIAIASVSSGKVESRLGGLPWAREAWSDRYPRQKCSPKWLYLCLY
jgi:SAM-dependent methyltransferase